MRTPALFSAVLGSVLFVGCDNTGETNCTDIALSSVIVTVESDVGAPLEGLVVTYTVDGSAPGSCLETGNPGEYSCGVEEAGLFEISASADDHGSDSVEVEVGEDACHVVPETTTLTLAALG